jgi:GntR family transcriptional repressor for pyruvate dehydrogenase complex
MKEPLKPVAKQSLSDRLANQVRALIQTGKYQEGDRLPTIVEMARRFGVGQPTVREALQKLQTMGIVDIRHGSGVYVARGHDVLVMASADYAGTVSKRLLLDLVRTRMPLEILSASGAAKNATQEHLTEMRRLLATARQNLDDDISLNAANMAFHREIARASGNTVLTQLVEALHDLFTEEQIVILGIFGSRERDNREHLGILDALEQHDEPLAVERMREHLEGIQERVVRWDPDDHPVT